LQAEDGIRDLIVTGVQTCALPIYAPARDVVHHGVECRVGLGHFGLLVRREADGLGERIDRHPVVGGRSEAPLATHRARFLGERWCSEEREQYSGASDTEHAELLRRSALYTEEHSAALLRFAAPHLSAPLPR